MDRGLAVRRGFTSSADIYLGLEEGSGKRESVSLFTFAPGSKKPMSKAQSGNSAYINTSWIQKRKPATKRKSANKNFASMN